MKKTKIDMELLELHRLYDKHELPANPEDKVWICSCGMPFFGFSPLFARTYIAEAIAHAPDKKFVDRIIAWYNNPACRKATDETMELRGVSDCGCYDLETIRDHILHGPSCHDYECNHLVHYFLAAAEKITGLMPGRSDV